MAFWRRLLGRGERDWTVLDEATARSGSFRKLAPALLPQLVDARRACGSRELSPLCDPFALGLVVQARGADGCLREVDVEPAARWNVALAAALRAAKDNLILSSLDRWRQPTAGLFVSPWNDGLDAARLCLPEIFRDVPLRGAPVVVPISRAHVAAAGADDEQGLGALAAHAREAARDADGPLPLLALQLEGMERWARCELPGLAAAEPRPDASARRAPDLRVA